MTKFNPKNKDLLSYGECLEPAMKIKNKADAQQYLMDYAKYIQSFLDKEPRSDGKTGIDIAKINLGYYAGYYSHETRERVERLFNCQHPIFGSVKDGSPSPEEAFELGRQMAENKVK